ncbi:hypothetical protein BHE74_00004793, partial [Ensete ventricosum]
KQELLPPRVLPPPALVFPTGPADTDPHSPPRAKSPSKPSHVPIPSPFPLHFSRSQMLTCIACSKQLGGGGGGGSPLHDPDDDEAIGADTPGTRQAIKALTAQIKDMAMRASGAYRHCKPCSGPAAGGRRRHHHGAYSDSEAASGSERFHYAYRRAGGSAASTPPPAMGRELQARLKALSNGERTPSVSGRTEASLEAASAFLEDGDDEEPKEWVAQVEPGVLITFFSLPQGGNDLKRIRFRYSATALPPRYRPPWISAPRERGSAVTASVRHGPRSGYLR